MIYSIEGVVTLVADDFLVLEANGIGYQVFCDGRTLSRLATGEVTRLFIYTLVREDQFTLFGVPNLEARQIFETLLKVNGVGAKMCLAIMSVLEAGEIVQAVQMQDVASFTRASGVGKKLAERIVMELKGKMGAVAVGSVSGGKIAAAGGVVGEVVSALVNLGYKAADAQKAAQAAYTDGSESFEALFKASLANLR